MFTTRSAVGSTRFAHTAAAIIIGDAGLAPQTAPPQGAPGYLRNIAGHPARST
ncbi:predicted protein [Streptomyces viridosporus ATCC 14672]|uniref:Predicted protein n=1 Tax=Streptomyces viridosporus (strain ATCC 14672 / DSM 40746 / JCM 4963 / KCTC 9882 / NRRL B-12104 / FH 1290) TaxID=566461 RepID=D6A2Z2_STRV1|nr:predicted protein [Streptomyces viridosporus ATCC 14672]